ncbi:UvrD-helicase domain-containing protein [Microbacterium jejuense]|uniref:DNA 3'-5' helicase n=1 Tax=Microbacterium jejuense TaxID=1263637 RepID=A0ABS7HKU1_9MICO|nr:UvrD-helicase domain-containing protein [Microbacterium jejuense]MBW9093313.1 UvrD-helicase domain-containing protein [Microbacterium jejuense]
MVRLTDAQVVAAAATDRLVNVVSAPGSGKTTVAAERYGYQRFSHGDLRGVIGLTFNRAAAAELGRRVRARWGSNCIVPPHRVVTFDHLHIDLLTFFLRQGKVSWPQGAVDLDVRDDYRGMRGHRFLQSGGYLRVAGLDKRANVISTSRRVTSPQMGIGNVDDHRAALSAGVSSHDDVREVLRAAMKVKGLREAAANWLSDNYRALIVDEVYDADDLDLMVVYLAAEAGLSVTIIGDPWQALYKWRGARPEVVEELLTSTTDRFSTYDQPESFRFRGAQMPQLARDLRAGRGVELPAVSSAEVDVALARNWSQLWSGGDNVLPLAFRTVNNAIDAAMKLLLDVITRTRLGVESYGRDGSIAKLGLSRERFRAEQDVEFGPLVLKLREGDPPSSILDGLREAARRMGARRPSRLSDDKEAALEQQLTMLATRLNQPTLIPGLTVFQAKGREWDRVGVVLSRSQSAILSSGLREHEEEHCIIYVALTRAKSACGRLTDSEGVAADALPLNL